MNNSIGDHFLSYAFPFNSYFYCLTHSSGSDNDCDILKTV